MSITLLSYGGVRVVLPDAGSLLLDRTDGGHLVVLPPRPVWERSELDARELLDFGLVVAAGGRAMLDALPQLDRGCINYWEAGNWALHDDAEPRGPKDPRTHRRMHLHLLGRSRTSSNPAWRWGESPRFPEFAERLTWSKGFARLGPDECRAVAARAEELLLSRWDADSARLAPRADCASCGTPAAARTAAGLCEECAG